ncbi:hypothetical protein C8035_v005547 [Colletotrichum spinosum]|uniref:Uncharacterized protein n=1 Tax=Colletotrichum spinosum TaxID=1347390 RepID=A0A4R8QNF6_9PEZI|nr:hypothetical protein C8035_v005547 [Colletotrichum spinosum]
MAKIEVYESDENSSDQQYSSIDELEADYANNNDNDNDISDQRLVTAYNSEQEFDPDYNWDFDSDLATEPDRDTSNQYDSEQQLDPGYNWDFDSDLATEPDRDTSNQYEQESSQFEQTNSHFERENSHFEQENSHFEQENSHFERESSQLSEESSLYDFVPASPDLDMEPLWPSSDAGPDVPSNEMELNAHHQKLDVETDKSLNDFIQATANMDWITNGDWGSPEPESVDNPQGHELARGAILSHLKSRYAGEESAGKGDPFSSQFGEYVQPCSNQNEGQLDQQQLQIDMSSLVQALQASEPPAPATAEDQGQASNHANIADQQEFISNLEDGWESQYFNDAMYGILDETDISEASSLCWPLPSSSAVATFSGTMAHGLITAQGKQSSEQIHNQETQSPDASLMPFHEDEISLSSLFQQPSLPLHASQHPALNKTTETVHKQRDRSPNASLVPGGESDIDVNSLVQQPGPPRHTLQRPAQNKPIKTVHKQHEYSRDASLAPSNESDTGGNFLIQQPRPPRPTLQLPAQIETAETAQKQHEPAQVAQEQIESSKSKKRKADSIVISEGEDEPAQVVQEQIKSNKSKKKKVDSIVISGGEDEPAQVAQKQIKSNKSKKNKAESIAISEGEDELSTMDLTPVPKKSRRKRSAEDSDEDYKPPAKRPRRSKGSTAARKTPQQKAAPQKPTPQQQVDPSQPQQPVKRGRGRPRKYPLPTNQASTAGTTQKQEVPPVPDKNIAVPSVTEVQSSAAQVTSTPAPSLKSASDQVATVSAKKQGRTPKTAKHATTEGTTGSNVDDFAPGQTVSVPAIANALSSMSQSRNEAIITPDRASKPTAPAVYKSLPSVSASRSTALPVKDHSISEKAQTLVLPARSTPARSSSQDIDMAEADKDMREYIERASSSPRQAVRAAGQSASSTAANGRLGGPGGTSIGRQPRIGGTPGWDPYSLAPTPLPISNIHSDAAAVAYRAHLPKNHWKMSQQEMIAYEEARPGYESFFKQHSNGQHQLREAAARGAQAQRIINGGDTSQSYGGNAGHSASDNALSDTGYGTPSTSAFQQSARGQGQRLLAPRPAPEAAAKASDVSQSWAGMASALASGPGADQNSGLIESIEKETGVQRKKAQKPKKAAAKPKKTNH